MVLLDAPESDSPVIVGHQPGDGSLDHRSPSAVVVSEVSVSPGPTGVDEFGIVRGHLQNTSSARLGAPSSLRTAAAPHAKGGGSTEGNRHGVPSRTGCRPVVVVDDEVVTVEGSWKGGPRRKWLDRQVVLGLVQCMEGLS